MFGWINHNQLKNLNKNVFFGANIYKKVMKYHFTILSNYNIICIVIKENLVNMYRWTN